MREIRSKFRNSLRGSVAVGLLLCLAVQPCPQELASTPLYAADETQPQKEQSEPEIKPGGQGQDRPRSLAVDPQLLKKKVEVHTKGGRVYRGKLIEIAPSYIKVRTNGPTEQIDLEQIATIQRQKARVGLALGIVGVAIGAIALVVLLVASSD